MVTERASQKRTALSRQRGFAKRLRREQTDAERKFWWQARDRGIGSYKFRRQYPVGPYIADFICLEAGLIVEIDGGQHAARQGHDEARTAYLESDGFRILRFWNADVLTNLDGVIERVLQELNMASAPSPRPSPPMGERENEFHSATNATSGREDLTCPGGKVRLFVAAALGEGARVAPDEGQAHYLLHVMRAKAGDRVSLFNGRDGEWLARIAEVSKRSCTMACERLIGPQREVPDLWLVFAPIKKTPSDYVVQKATELGVRALKPVFTRRTIVARVNLERMRANAVEAAEQSGRLSVPEIAEAQNLAALLAQWPAERRLMFCDEAGEAPPIASALADASDGPWAVLTGPEGGFDPSERDLLRTQPFVVPVALGARILRADTASLAALAVWQSVKGDWR